MFAFFRSNIRLKLLIFLTLTLISSIPVIQLAYWVQRSAVQREVDAVEEKHLLIAGNISRAFERYAKDTKAVFAHISANFGVIDNLRNVDKLLNSMGISDLCTVDANGALNGALRGDRFCSFSLTNDHITRLRAKARDKPGEVSISRLRRIDDRPVFFLVHGLSENRIAVGTLETSYLIEIQKSIAFGKLGHSMVVDATGRVIAHPNKEWETISKDASKLSVVQKMMRGETGVSTFYSPPMQADMIAGHTSVPGVDWGVMVPQPYSELLERAEEVQWAALLITILGLTVAAFLGWIAARVLANPIEAVSKTAIAIASGDESARVTNVTRNTAREVRELTTSFNQMVDRLSNSRADIQRHRDNLERLVSERTEALEHEMQERKHAEVVLQQQKQHLDVTLESIGDGVITSDANNNINYLNPVAEKLTGWSMQEACGQTLSAVLSFIDVHSGEPVELLPSDNKENQTYDGLLVRRDNSTVDVQKTVAKIKGADSKLAGLVIVVRDVTETRKLSRKLSYEASHDALTGLLNRRAFENRVTEAIQEAAQEHCVHSLCYLDLDQFKIVNDTCGHAAGDEMLCAITGLIKQRMRKSDSLARLGGDEFGILFNMCPIDTALDIAEKIRQHIQDFRFVHDDHNFRAGVSIGLTEINNSSESLGNILNAADSACYLAKERGRNRIETYAPTDEETVERAGELMWVGRMHAALEDDQFELHAQPIISLAYGPEAICHYELLLRLRHEPDTLTLPGTFLPAAARYKLLPSIDRWVFAKAIEWLRQSQAMLEGGRISINLTGETLSEPKFLNYVQDLLNEHQVDASSLIIEITENSALNNLRAALKFISALSEMGCQFALDDFGTGFSSLSNLKNLPVDYIKIDGDFVRDILTDPIDETMVKTICEIGHTLGKTVIAEFVESDAIQARLCELGIDFGQGYGIARPTPISEFASLSQQMTRRARAS